MLKAVTAMCLLKAWPGQSLPRRLAVATLTAVVAPAIACSRILVDNKVLQPATALHQVRPLISCGLPVAVPLCDILGLDFTLLQPPCFHHVAPSTRVALPSPAASLLPSHYHT
jgi:hypothetical protein